MTIQEKISDELEKKSFKSTLDDLQTAVENTVKFFGQLNEDDLPNLLRAFKLLHDNSKYLDTIKKVVDGLYDQYAEEVLPRVFEKHEVDSLKMHGRNFVFTARMFCSINNENKEEAFNWLTDHGLSSLIQPTVNAKQLTSSLVELLENEAISPPDTLIKSHKQKTIVVRKA